MLKGILIVSIALLLVINVNVVATPQKSHTVLPNAIINAAETQPIIDSTKNILETQNNRDSNTPDGLHYNKPGTLDIKGVEAAPLHNTAKNLNVREDDKQRDDVSRIRRKITFDENQSQVRNNDSDSKEALTPLQHPVNLLSAIQGVKLRPKEQQKTYTKIIAPKQQTKEEMLRTKLDSIRKASQGSDNEQSDSELSHSKISTIEKGSNNITAISTNINAGKPNIKNDTLNDKQDRWAQNQARYLEAEKKKKQEERERRIAQIKLMAENTHLSQNRILTNSSASELTAEQAQILGYRKRLEEKRAREASVQSENIQRTVLPSQPRMIPPPPPDISAFKNGTWQTQSISYKDQSSNKTTSQPRMIPPPPPPPPDISAFKNGTWQTQSVSYKDQSSNKTTALVLPTSTQPSETNNISNKPYAGKLPSQDLIKSIQQRASQMQMQKQKTSDDIDLVLRKKKEQNKSEEVGHPIFKALKRVVPMRPTSPQHNDSLSNIAEWDDERKSNNLQLLPNSASRATLHISISNIQDSQQPLSLPPSANDIALKSPYKQSLDHTRSDVDLNLPNNINKDIPGVTIIATNAAGTVRDATVNGILNTSIHDATLQLANPAISPKSKNNTANISHTKHTTTTNSQSNKVPSSSITNLDNYDQYEGIKELFDSVEQDMLSTDTLISNNAKRLLTNKEGMSVENPIVKASPVVSIKTAPTSAASTLENVNENFESLSPGNIPTRDDSNNHLYSFQSENNHDLGSSDIIGYDNKQDVGGTNVTIVEQLNNDIKISQLKGATEISTNTAQVASMLSMITSIANHDILFTRMRPIFTAIAAGDEEIRIPKGLWFSGIYVTSKQGMLKNIAGYKGSSRGITIGFDITLGQEIENLLGIAYSHVSSNFKPKDQYNKISISSHVVSFYGQKTLGHNLSLQGMFSTACNYITNKALRFFANAQYSVTGKHRNISYNLDTRLHYAIATNYGVTIVPNIGIKYGQYRDGTYNETNIGAYNLSVAAKSQNLWAGFVGSRVLLPAAQVTKNITVTPMLHGSIEKYFNSHNQKISSKVSIGNTSFAHQTTVSKQSTIGYNIGTSLLLDRRNTMLSIEYNCYLRKKYQSHQASARFRIIF